MTIIVKPNDMNEQWINYSDSRISSEQLSDEKSSSSSDDKPEQKSEDQVMEKLSEQVMEKSEDQVMEKLSEQKPDIKSETNGISNNNLLSSDTSDIYTIQSIIDEESEEREVERKKKGVKIVKECPSERKTMFEDVVKKTFMNIMLFSFLVGF